MATQPDPGSPAPSPVEQVLADALGLRPGLERGGLTSTGAVPELCAPRVDTAVAVVVAGRR